MTVEKLEMCEFLSEDYAQRASNRGMDYKKSYDSYMERTQKRSFQDLLQHFSTVKKFPTVIKSNRNEEYVITKSDDDCEDCTTSNLQDILVNCTDWTVNRLKRNAMDYDNAYDGYYFNFFSDNTLSVYWGSTTVYGTWTANGSGNTLEQTSKTKKCAICRGVFVFK